MMDVKFVPEAQFESIGVFGSTSLLVFGLETMIDYFVGVAIFYLVSTGLYLVRWLLLKV